MMFQCRIRHEEFPHHSSSLLTNRQLVPFTLDTVITWGRSFDEYAAMFALSAADLAGPILGCGDGPASFNAELTRLGGQVTSVDPIYQFDGEAIRTRIEAVYPMVMAQTEANRDGFVWTSIGSIQELGEKRMSSMDRFLEDYDVGRREQRYITAELPSLPFADGAFTLALVSHLLFLYTEQLSEDIHRQSVRELRRVAREVRIFPLLDLARNRSRHLDAVIADAQSCGDEAVIVPVAYEFQRGACEMLRIRSAP